MTKPLATVMRTNDVACGARDLAQRCGRPGCVFADTFLDQSPRGLDGVQVVRIRRQKSHGRAPRLNELSDGRRFVCVEVVEQDNVSATEPWRQAGAHPCFEA